MFRNHRQEFITNSILHSNTMNTCLKTCIDLLSNFTFFLVKVIRNVQEQATQDLVIGGFKVKDKQNIMAQPCCGVKYYIK